MTNQIVTVNVSQTIAPTPNQLQRTGALVSQGGTTLPPGTFGLLTQDSDLTPLLVTPQTNISLTWLASVVTVTTAVAHGYPVGSVIQLTISGATPAGYNGTFACTITSSTAFTYALTSNPGTETAAGTTVSAFVSEIQSMVTTFYAQPGQLAVYVLELGVGTSTTGIAALQTYIVANPGFFYSYLIPRGWDADTSYPAFLGNYNANNAKVYFHTTVTLSTYTNISKVNKCAPMFCENATVNAGGTGEFSMAAMFWVTLNANPSSSNKVPPLCFSFLVGVTPAVLTNTQITQLRAANCNYAGTGAEGGVSNIVLYWGRTPDGNPWNFWYSTDWSQVNLDLNLANTLLNGSNTSINPLYYDQNGVDRLQGSAVQTMQQAIAFGLALGQLVQTALDSQTFADNVSSGVYAGQVVVNAVPFITWTTANPAQFPEGIYGGLTVLYTPARGFEQILVNLNVSDLA